MDVPSIILACVALIGIVMGALAWLYKRGADERELTIVMRDNSEATRTLSKSFTAYVEKADQRYTALENRVSRHDTRITVAERDIDHLRHNGTTPVPHPG